MKILIVFIFGFLSYSSAKTESCYSLPDVEFISTNTEVAIIIWVDKSGSIRTGEVEKITFEDIEPLIDLIDQVGGTISIGIIGASTRSVMAFYSNQTVENKPPERDPRMSAKEYREELMRFMKRRNRPTLQINQNKVRAEFELKVREMLIYENRLENMSLIHEALNVSARIIAQPNHNNVIAYVIMVTDFKHNGKESAPTTLGKNTEVLIINRLSKQNFNRYDSQHYVDFRSAVRHVISKS